MYDELMLAEVSVNFSESISNTFLQTLSIGRSIKYRYRQHFLKILLKTLPTAFQTCSFTTLLSNF